MRRTSEDLHRFDDETHKRVIQFIGSKILYPDLEIKDLKKKKYNFKPRI